jgi:hypothetical protein
LEGIVVLFEENEHIYMSKKEKENKHTSMKHPMKKNDTSLNNERYKNENF